MKLSIVLPIYNEAESLQELIPELFYHVQNLGYDYEVIAVNDGSSDNTAAVLNELAQQKDELKIIHFRSNAGQTSALHAGIAHATGDIIIPIDADLENNPKDIVRLLEKLNEGYDVVSGWRKNRWNDSRLLRRLPSIIANKIISSVSGLSLHDYGCTLKAYRREVIQDLHLYGEMHRFIPAYASQIGAKVTEIEVSYTPRKYGKSKYGFSRTTRVLLDLIVMRFLHRYLDRPMQFFGSIGIMFGFLGVIAGVTAIILRFSIGLHLVETPLPIFSALCIIVGVQLVTMGILAEMVMRTYYESQDKRTYFIARKVNF